MRIVWIRPPQSYCFWQELFSETLRWSENEIHTRKPADITVSNFMLVHHGAPVGLFDSSSARVATSAGSNRYSWASSAEESKSGLSCLIIASGSKDSVPNTRKYLSSTHNRRQRRAAWSSDAVTIWNWSIAHKNKGKTKHKALLRVCVTEVAEIKPNRPFEGFG